MRRYRDDLDLVNIEAMLAEALVKAGGVESLAKVIDLDKRCIFRWKKREFIRHDETTLYKFFLRLYVYLQGDDLEAREERVARFESNVAKGLSPWGHKRERGRSA